MKLYTAHAYLSHKGSIVKPDEQLELSDEQVKRLGDKVSPATNEEQVEHTVDEIEDIEQEDVEVESDPIRELDLTVDELKAMAKDKGVKGFHNMNKESLIKAVQEAMQDEAE